MISLTEARTAVRLHLQPYFEHKNYGERSPLVFERRTNFGSSVFIATVTGNHEMAYAKFFVGIRHDLIEAALRNSFGLNEYFQNSSYTLLVNLKDIVPDSFPSSLPFDRLEDVNTIGDMAIDFMDRKGFDFLNHYKHLGSLDYLYNDVRDKAAKWNNHSYLHKFRAMAIAKLAERSDYDRLFQKHRRYLENRGYSGSILKKYDTTLAHFKKLSLN